MINYVKDTFKTDDYKQFFFGILYTSRTFMKKEKIEILNKLPCLNNLYNQLYEALLSILKHKHENIYNLIKKDKKEKRVYIVHFYLMFYVI